MEPKSYLIDMDGVLVRGQQIIPGADIFLSTLHEKGTKFLVLTNNAMYTPGDLAHRLRIIGLPIDADHIFTSAMATGRFLQSQRPDGTGDGDHPTTRSGASPGTAFVIGESGLTEAVHSAGYVITDVNPDYVVLGETFAYNLDYITRAIRLVASGAHFIATNPDPTGPTEQGIAPACGAMAALIEKASGRSPFFVGKPNPFMMRSALNHLGVHSENTVMIGDRMDTDIVAGIESGMETVLVLSGVTRREQIADYPFQPHHVVESVADLTIDDWAGTNDG